MKADGNALAVLAGSFAVISLFAIGGANTTTPEIHRLVVEGRHWMSGRQFTELFALAQAAPGPNVIFVTLIGYHVAGILGALAATLGMCAPACLLAYTVGRIFDRTSGASWQTTLRQGLLPVTLGLTAATAVVVARAADTTWLTVAISLGSAVVFYWMRLHPLWVFGAAALLGLVGLA
jgi:chromate transporter